MEKMKQQQQATAAADNPLGSTEELDQLPETTVSEMQINYCTVVPSNLHKIVLPADHLHQDERIFDLWLPQKYNKVQLLESKKFSWLCSLTDTDTGDNKAMLFFIFRVPPPLLPMFRAINIARFLYYHKPSSICQVQDVEFHKIKGKSGNWSVDKLVIFYEHGTTLKDLMMRTGNVEVKDFKRLLAQMLMCLADLHSFNLVHRNVNPSSFLIESLEGCMKLCDLARVSYTRDDGLLDYSSDDHLDMVYQLRDLHDSIDNNSKKVSKAASKREKDGEKYLRELYEKLYRPGTAAFRSPELLLGCKGYGQPTDVWAVGCTFAFLLRKRLLFKAKSGISYWFTQTRSSVVKSLDKRAHTNNEGEFEAIISVLGSEFIDNLDFLNANESGCELALEKKNESVVGTDLFAEFHPILDNEGVDILVKLLKFSPIERLSAKEALQHPYLKDVVEDIHKEMNKEDLITVQFEMLNIKNMDNEGQWKAFNEEMDEFFKLKGPMDDGERATEKEETAQNARAAEEEGRAMKKQKVEQTEGNLTQPKNQKPSLSMKDSSSTS